MVNKIRDTHEKITVHSQIKSESRMLLFDERSGITRRLYGGWKKSKQVFKKIDSHNAHKKEMPKLMLKSNPLAACDMTGVL